MRRILSFTIGIALPILSLGLPTAVKAQQFSDIQGNPYQMEIQAAAKAKIIAGFEDGTFRPNQPVTREQAVSMIVDALATLTPINLEEQPTRATRPFTDINKAGDWSRAKIEWAQWNILPAGTATGEFRPQDNITRAELVAFLRRSAELLQVKMGKSSFLTPTQKPITFTDVSGFNLQLTEQMSAYCGVASAVNDKGTKFAPTQPAHRDYTAAAIMRTLSCVEQAPS